MLVQLRRGLQIVPTAVSAAAASPARAACIHRCARLPLQHSAMNARAMATLSINDASALQPHHYEPLAPLHAQAQQLTKSVTEALTSGLVKAQAALEELLQGLWLVSTMKRKRTKMNKHKLKKRRRKMRYSTKRPTN